MLLDARNPQEVPENITGETVIIGAGTVGLLLAVCLVKANKPVLLVEAGGRVADTSHNGETAESLGKRHSGASTSRAAGLGGTSVLWGGQLAEFEDVDFDREGSEWPLSYGDLRQWYERIYDLLGVARGLPVERYRQMFGGEADVNPDVERFFTFWLPRPNFATLFRREIVSSPLMRVVLNAAVNDIAFAGHRAEAVSARAPGGRQIRVAGTDFVFAGGTIANNRFFLNAQRRPAVPWTSNVHIGTRFQDHLGGKIADVELTDERRFRAYFENGFTNRIKLQPKLRLARKARAGTVSGACGLFAFNSDVGEHLANIKQLVRSVKSGAGFSKLRTLPRDILTLNRAFAPFVARYIRERRVLAFLDRGVEFHVQAEQLPVAESRIRLIEGATSPDGLLRVAVDWRIDGREMDAIRKIAAGTDSYLQARGLARLRLDPMLRQDGLIERFNDTGHPCGGLRMAATSRDGVTDPECRVWDTANVYVAGAAVFPTSSHANCTLTALALSARLAHRLAGRA